MARPPSHLSLFFYSIFIHDPIRRLSLSPLVSPFHLFNHPKKRDEYRWGTGTRSRNWADWARQSRLSTRWAWHSNSTAKRSTTKKVFSFFFFSFLNRLLSWLHVDREPRNKKYTLKKKLSKRTRNRTQLQKEIQAKRGFQNQVTLPSIHSESRCEGRERIKSRSENRQDRTPREHRFSR